MKRRQRSDFGTTPRFSEGAGTLRGDGRVRAGVSGVPIIFNLDAHAQGFQ